MTPARQNGTIPPPMPGEPKTMADLVRISGEMVAADFVQVFPHPFLVASGVLGVRIPRVDDEIVGEATAVIDIRPGLSHAPGTANPLAGQIYIVRKRVEGAEGVITVGRGDENDIVVLDPSVSHTHGYFERDGASIWVADIGSTNGTEVNLRRISVGERIPLEDEDVVTFGRVSFQIFRPLALFVALLEFRGLVD